MSIYEDCFFFFLIYLSRSLKFPVSAAWNFHVKTWKKVSFHMGVSYQGGIQLARSSFETPWTLLDRFIDFCKSSIWVSLLFSVGRIFSALLSGGKITNAFRAESLRDTRVPVSQRFRRTGDVDVVDGEINLWARYFKC